MKTIRLGTGTAFWGHMLDGAFTAVEKGNIDYLCSDHLAELTLCILQKLKRRNPEEGYTRDLIPMMKRVLPVCAEKGIKIIDNGGGTNPMAAADKIVEIATELGLKGLKIGVVVGDDITDRIDELQSKGVSFSNMDTGEDFRSIKDSVVNATVYIGYEPILEALEQGADVVITGRVSDLAVFLAPMVHEFGWKADDWDLLASGAVIAHTMECGAQAVGGNYAAGWKDVPEPWRMSYPIADVYENGEAIITHVEGEGGLVTIESIKEQLVYEILDPTNFLTPDVTADFTTINLQEAGKNRVKISGVKGRARPDTLKVSMGYEDGFMAESRAIYSFPGAIDKAKRGSEIVLRRLEMGGVKPEEVRIDYIGMNSLWGTAAPPIEYEPNEIELRVAIKTKTAAEAGLLGREMVALGLIGPAGFAGYTSPGKPRELVAFWPALVPRDEVQPSVIMKTV
jgi:hypothetical protein